VTMKNNVFWDITLCGSCRTDVSEKRGVYIIRVTRIGDGGTLTVISNHSVWRLRVTPSVVPSSPSLVTLMIEALHFREKSVLTRATRE
jgi:hypothetical protein